MIYDAAVIGTGPAGVSAALTLKANNKEFLIFHYRNLFAGRDFRLTGKTFFLGDPV